jgi:hypothetical protein
LKIEKKRTEHGHGVAPVIALRVQSQSKKASHSGPDAGPEATLSAVWDAVQFIRPEERRKYRNTLEVARLFAEDNVWPGFAGLRLPA